MQISEAEAETAWDMESTKLIKSTWLLKQLETIIPHFHFIPAIRIKTEKLVELGWALHDSKS